MSRKPIFAANWKMNKGSSETEDFVKSFLSKTQGFNLPADIVIAPPFVCLPKLADLLHNSNPGKNAHASPIRFIAPQERSVPMNARCRR